MRSAVYVLAVVTAFEKGIPDLGHAAIQRKVAADGHGRLGFVTVGAGGTFEFETAVVGDVDLLVGVVDEKGVGRDG